MIKPTAGKTDSAGIRSISSYAAKKDTVARILIAFGSVCCSLTMIPALGGAIYYMAHRNVRLAIICIAWAVGSFFAFSCFQLMLWKGDDHLFSKAAQVSPRNQKGRYD